MPSASIIYTQPPPNAAAVTPSDTTDLAHVTTCLWVGTQGDVEVDTLGGQTVVFPDVIGHLSGRFTRVRAANTTASGIVARW